MKLPMIWLCLPLLFPGVLCSLQAGPYQSVFLWYAYRMDVMANGPSGLTIAANCVGSLPDRTCTFDEFLKHIQNTGANTKIWTGSTTVGDDLTPDVVATANELATGGTAGTPSRYPNSVLASALLPNQFGDVGKANLPSFSQVFDPITETIQKARVELGSAVDIQVAALRQAITTMQFARIQEQANGLIEAVNEQLKKKGLRPAITKQVTAPDGVNKVTVIDTEATINANSGKELDLKTTITNLVSNYDAADKNSIRHFKAIQGVQSIQNRIYGDPDC